jgi:hypothetical protein
VTRAGSWFWRFFRAQYLFCRRWSTVPVDGGQEAGDGERRERLGKKFLGKKEWPKHSYPGLQLFFFFFKEEFE